MIVDDLLDNSIVLSVSLRTQPFWPRFYRSSKLVKMNGSSINLILPNVALIKCGS